MKVHMTVLHCLGASMRCGINLPDTPTADSIREVARVFLKAGHILRLPIWRDGVELDLLVSVSWPNAPLPLPPPNPQATAILRQSLHERTGRPLADIDDMIRGTAVLIEPQCWPGR
jgi:hypothetical protein